MSQVMEHVRQLAEVIGPRPATTDAEARAADYIEDVLAARGLEIERQEFDCPRTYSWAYVLYHTFTLLAAALALAAPVPAFVLAALVAVFLLSDLDTRFGLTRLMPKGPSQNIVARHLPRQRRGDRRQRVVIVAHYDSARSSLAFSPGLVRNFATTFALMKAATVLTPAVILVGALPFAAEWRPWTGYASLAAAAYLVVPLFINVHRELFMTATAGANDNASGVAAMLGVMETIVPEPEVPVERSRSRMRDERVALEAGVVDDDVLLEYRPLGAPAEEPGTLPLEGFGEVGWETGPMPAVTPSAPLIPAYAPSDRAEERAPSYGDDDDGAPAEALWDDGSESDRDGLDASGQERFDLEHDEEPASAEAESARGIREWLGVGRGFDVRKTGRSIGTWENFEPNADAEDEDEFGFKAGTAGEEPADEAAEEDVVSRIRRKVTESIDRSLAEKEIWFVATGAEETGTWGMRAFLAEYEEDLRDALIINIDNVGSGKVAFVTQEGMARRYRADRRLASQAKRTARESGMAVGGVPYRGLSTDATPALARGYRAMSVMAFDINGRLPHWHWRTDTVDSVHEPTVVQAAEFVTALIRDL